MKRIVLCFDGTWNTPDDETDDGDESTNVHLLWKAVAAADAAGVVQDKWYDEGVGTKWYTKVPGGAFGVGLSENIRVLSIIGRFLEHHRIFHFVSTGNAYVSSADYEATGASELLTEGIIDHVRALEGTVVAGVVRDLVAGRKGGAR